jgi:hypothetical protein
VLPHGLVYSLSVTVLPHALVYSLSVTVLPHGLVYSLSVTVLPHGLVCSLSVITLQNKIHYFFFFSKFNLDSLSFSPTYALIYIIKILSQEVTLNCTFNSYMFKSLKTCMFGDAAAYVMRVEGAMLCRSEMCN